MTQDLSNPNHILLQDMTDEEAAKIFLAHKCGQPLEYYSVFNKDWKPATNGPSLDYAYRILHPPSRHASIDWSHVAPEFRFMAMDENKKYWLYVARPTHSGCREYWTVGKNRVTRAENFASFRPGENVNWKDSLVCRPESPTK